MNLLFMRKKILGFFIFINIFGLFSIALIRSGTCTESVTLFSENFSTPISGWNKGWNTWNAWQDGPPPFGDHGGAGGAIGTNVLAPYIDNTNTSIELSSPTIDLSESGLINIELTFWHWYNFSNSLNDGGGIYLYDGSKYINPLNDYPSAVSGDKTTINHIAGLDYSGHLNEQGWAYNSSGEWRSVTIDISAIGLTNTDFNITFIFGYIPVLSNLSQFLQKNRGKLYEIMTE